MKTKPLLFLMGMLPLIAYSQKKITTYYDYQKTEAHEIYYTDNYGTKNGTYTEYSEYGGVLQQGTYKNDKMVGKWMMKSDKGILMMELNFDNNTKFDGQILIYAFDGHLHYQETYLHGIKIGTWKTYFTSEDGDNAFTKVKDEATHYSAGEDRDSVAFKQYRLTGRLSIEGFAIGHQSFGDLTSYGEQDPFNDYSNVGTWKYFDEEGMLVKVTDWSQGKYYNINYYKNIQGLLGVVWRYENDCYSCSDYKLFSGYGIGDSITFDKVIVTNDTIWSHINVAIAERYQKQEATQKIAYKQAEITQHRQDSLSEVLRKQAEIGEHKQDSLNEIARKQAETSLKITQLSYKIDSLYKVFNSTYVGSKKSLFLVDPKTRQPIMEKTYPHGKHLYIKSDTLIKTMRKDLSMAIDLDSKLSIEKNIVAILNKLVALSNGDTTNIDKQMKKVETMDDIKKVLGVS